MSKITIKDEKTPTRCEICHKADMFIPHLNSCFRCDDIDAGQLNESDEQVATIYQHYQYHHQEAQASNYQYQRVISSVNRDSASNSFTTELNSPEKSLMLNNLIQFPSLPDRKTQTKAKKYIPFPKPKPKVQPSVLFNFVMCAGVIMAILFLFSLLLTK